MVVHEAFHQKVNESHHCETARLFVRKEDNMSGQKRLLSLDALDAQSAFDLPRREMLHRYNTGPVDINITIVQINVSVQICGIAAHDSIVICNSDQGNNSWTGFGG